MTVISLAVMLLLGFGLGPGLWVDFYFFSTVSPGFLDGFLERRMFPQRIGKDHPSDSSSWFHPMFDLVGVALFGFTLVSNETQRNHLEQPHLTSYVCFSRKKLKEHHSIFVSHEIIPHVLPPAIPGQPARPQSQPAPQAPALCFASVGFRFPTRSWFSRSPSNWCQLSHPPFLGLGGESRPKINDYGKKGTLALKGI